MKRWQGGFCRTLPRRHRGPPAFSIPIVRNTRTFTAVQKAPMLHHFHPCAASSSSNAARMMFYYNMQVRAREGAPNIRKMEWGRARCMRRSMPMGSSRVRVLSLAPVGFFPRRFLSACFCFVFVFFFLLSFFPIPTLFSLFFPFFFFF